MKKWLLLSLIALLGSMSGLLLLGLIGIKVFYRIANGLGISWPASYRFAWVLEMPFRARTVPRILDWTDIREGEQVLELGSGPGVYTVAAAQRVGTHGQLTAIDIQPEMIARAARKVRDAGLSNVQLLVGDACHLPLEDASIDRAFLVGVLYETAHPRQALNELHRVLKPNGILSITEAFLDPDYRFARENRLLLEKAGFEPVHQFGNLWRHTTNFRKRGTG